MGYLVKAHSADLPDYLFVSETQKHSEFIPVLFVDVSGVHTTVCRLISRRR